MRYHANVPIFYADAAALNFGTKNDDRASGWFASADITAEAKKKQLDARRGDG